MSDSDMVDDDDEKYTESDDDSQRNYDLIEALIQEDINQQEEVRRNEHLQLMQQQIQTNRLQKQREHAAKYGSLFKRIETEMKNEIDLYFVKNINYVNDRRIPEVLDHYFVEFCTNISRQSKRFESLTELAFELLYEDEGNPRCDCNSDCSTYGSDEDEIIASNLNISDVIVHLVALYSDLPKCSLIEAATQYVQIEKRLFTIAEIEQFITQTQAINSNPMDFTEINESLHKSTENISNLKNYVVNNSNKDSLCCWCQDSIKIDQKVVQLPGCKHTFHYCEIDCLGDTTVLKWLKNRDKCPECRSQIKL